VQGIDDDMVVVGDVKVMVGVEEGCFFQIFLSLFDV
jgi:hypothetical protein